MSLTRLSRLLWPLFGMLLSVVNGFIIDAPVDGEFLYAGAIQFKVSDLDITKTYIAFIKTQADEYLNQRSFKPTDLVYYGYLSVPYFITNATIYEFGIKDLDVTPNITTVTMHGSSRDKILTPSPDYDALQSEQSIILSFIGAGFANMGSDAAPYVYGAYTIDRGSIIAAIMYLDQNTSKYATNTSYFLDSGIQDYVLLELTIELRVTSTAWVQYTRPPISAARIPRNLLGM
jgi:hypothetical protein